MQTEVTRLLGIEYPIIQGGMAWVAEYHLASGVSNAGGLGLIGAASAPADWVREQVREAKKLTDKPFGVNIMLMSPYADEVAKDVYKRQARRNAAKPSAYKAYFSPAFLTSVSAMMRAPPLSSRSLPSMTPSPIGNPMPAIRFPNPVPMFATVSTRPRLHPMPIMRLPKISPMTGFSFNLDVYKRQGFRDFNNWVFTPQ